MKISFSELGYGFVQVNNGFRKNTCILFLLFMYDLTLTGIVEGNIE